MHAIFPDITTFYGGRVIGVNVSNAKNRKEERGRSILIEKSAISVVGDNGFMRRLPPVE